MKKKIGYLLATLLVLAAVGIFGFNTKAADSKNYRTDGTEAKYKGDIDEGFFADASKQSSLRKESRGNAYVRRKGIDVSHWQNDAGPINWQQVKASGVEFVIVKLGGRYNDGTFYEDPCYKQNIEGATKAGLKVGVYFWSEAVTEAEAREEANFCIDRIYKYNIEMPICMDYEWCADKYKPYCRLYNSGQNAAQRTAVANAFMKQCQSAGYTGMLYANKSMLTDDFNGTSLAENGKVWVAQYLYMNPSTKELHNGFNEVTSTYENVHDFYQFTSHGVVPGITGRVDLNYWYDDGSLYGQDYTAIFDATYYANKYPDVKEAYGTSASALLKHFLNYGMAEGRQGCEEFDVNSYRMQYADLRRTYGNNLKQYYIHYMMHGKKEGRVGTGCTKLQGVATVYNGVNYSAVYDYNYYVSKYKDVYKAYGFNDTAVLAHFVNNGLKEGRQGNAKFNLQSYINRYADLRAVFGNNRMSYVKHYINSGRKEGRIAVGYEKTLVGASTVYKGVNYSAVYDYNYYVNKYPAVKKAYGYNDAAVLEYFVKTGLKSGQQGKANFNLQSYKNRYADLRAAFGNNDMSYVLHYINSGQREGRLATGYENTLCGTTTSYKGVNYALVYDYNYYINRYPDLKKAFGSNDMAAIQHFVENGLLEGRQGNNKFNINVYMKRYADLRAAFGNNRKAYVIHYINNGSKEGRTAI